MKHLPLYQSAPERRIAAIAVALLLAVTVWPGAALHAQLCDGALNLRVSASTEKNDLFSDVTMTEDSTGVFFVDQITSSDGR
ncbi:MAG: hypothetical protein JWQ98_2169 [Chlorobi bacterium]|nr:hypothetical protein [Chlorobiota bacterium]